MWYWIGAAFVAWIAWTVRDLVRAGTWAVRRDTLRDLFYGGLGGVTGGAVCFGVGYLIVMTIGPPEATSFGVGLEPWNLPGTMLGLATWVGIVVYALRKRDRQRPTRPHAVRPLFPLFKRRISVDEAVSAFSFLTQDIERNYISKVFPGASLSDSKRVQTELRFLAMYVIDGLLKNPTSCSWLTHQEALGKRYYLACAQHAEAQDLDSFMFSFLERLNHYNQALSEHAAEFSQIANRADRIARVDVLAARVFAELCGCPDDALHIQIAGGAIVTLNLSTERLL